jgi:23S rRNA (cytosine1962-C5)-methyltransferase
VKSLKTLLVEAAKKRRFSPPGSTTAFRMLHGEGDGIPGVTVDWFDGVAVISLYDEASEETAAEILDAVQEVLRPRSIYFKHRPREARVVANTERAKVAPETPERGEPVEELEVKERGLSFLIRPGQGLSVGLYLDAREARAWVRAHAKGLRVLNAFAYTGGFGVAAKVGGAVRAVNLDVSRRVLEWGEANARLNGVSVESLVGDAFDWLKRLRKKGERFDLVILDPPSFATTRQSRFSAVSHYGGLVEQAVPLLEPGGTLLACCNLAQLSAARFKAMVLQGAEEAGRSARVVQSFGASATDFPPPAGLKILAVEIA